MGLGQETRRYVTSQTGISVLTDFRLKQCHSEPSVIETSWTCTVISDDSLRDLGQETAFEIVRATYHGDSKFSSDNIMAATLLKDYASKVGRPGFDRLKHPLLRIGRLRLKGEVDMIIHLANAPSNNQISVKCKNVRNELTSVGQLTRYILVLQHHAPKLASMERATQMYCDINKDNRKASIDPDGQDDPNTANPDTLKRSWRKLMTVSHFLFAIDHVGVNLLDLWNGSAMPEQIVETLGYATLIRKGLEIITPAKSRSPSHDDPFRQTHMRAEDMKTFGWDAQAVFSESDLLSALSITSCEENYISSFSLQSR